VTDHLRIGIPPEQLPKPPAVVEMDVRDEDEIEMLHPAILERADEGGDRRRRARIHENRGLPVRIKPARDEVPETGHRQGQVHHAKPGGRGRLVHFMPFRGWFFQPLPE